MAVSVKSFCVLAILAMLLSLQPVHASCSLKITKVSPCLATGAPGTPEIGTPYGIRVTFNVTGTPSKPFAVKFTIANVSHTFNNYSLKQGNGYWTYCVESLPLDDAIPYSVTLDPANVSGNTNPNTTVTGTFSPKAPAAVVQTYSPSTKHGAVSRTVAFSSGATLTELEALLGVPTSHGTQQAVSFSGPAIGGTLNTPPYNLPVFQIQESNVPSGTFVFNDSFTVTLSRMRVNPVLLRKITWASLSTMSAEYTQWLAADTINESTDPKIAAFVANALPANYRTAMTPYDAARTLHRAVMRSLSYVEPPPYRDAVASLDAGEGDCGCYSALLASALRYIGIPARRISGFWQGFSQSHVRVEFYLPGANWMVADPTLGNGVDPTGTYAYFFGSVPDGDKFVSVDVGDSHTLTSPSIQAQDLQTPNFWYWSGSNVSILSDTQFSYLQTGATDEYTLLLKPGSSGAGIPAGFGYGLLTMSSTGGIILAGQLADGESFSTSGAIGGNGGDQFVFNTPLSYSGGAQGLLSGTLNFVTTTGPFETTGTGDLAGTIAWTKPQQSGGNFPAAFQTSLSAIGSLYLPPGAANPSVLPGFKTGTLTLSGTGSIMASGSVTLTKNVTLTAANVFNVVNSAADKLKIAVTPATGVIKGTFTDRAGGKPALTSFTGVVFQQEANGGGFFLGPDNSGSVILAP